MYQMQLNIRSKYFFEFIVFHLKQGWPNFLDRGPFSEIWTKAWATPHDSIFHYLVDMCYD